MNPTFPEGEVEKERNVIVKEIKMRNDQPGTRAAQLLWSTAYTTHPYRHPIIGYEDILVALTRADLLSYHKQNYTPNNLVVGICGDINTDTALKEAEALFSEYRRQPYVGQPLPSEPRQITQRTYEERTDVKLARVVIGYQSIPIWHKDLFALDVLASALGEGKSSILHRRLVENDKIAHAVRAYNYTPQEPGLFFVSVLLDEHNIPKALQAVDEEIGNIQAGTIDHGQLEKARNSTLAGFILQHETIQAQARDMVEGEILVGNPDFSRYYVEGIEKATPDEVVRVAKVYLQDATQTIVSLLPEGDAPAEAQQITAAGFDVDVQKFTLPNGMRVVIREDHSLPIVALRAVFQGGTRVEKVATNGISNITAESLLYGTKERLRDDIYSGLERRGGSIGSFSGNNSFGISMTILSQHLEYGIALVSDVLLNPAFPDDELKKLKNLLIAAIQNREDDIFASGMRLFKQNLFTGHPYQFTVLGEEKSLKGIKKKHVVKFYRQFCVPPNCVLAVFGDVDAQETMALLKRHFTTFRGNMPRVLAGKTPRLKKRPFPAEQVMQKEQVLVIGGFRTIAITDPDVHAFSVLASILSGSDGRFFYDVRDALGISYTQGAASVPGLDPGSFLFYIATAPEHAELAKKLIADEITTLQKEPITDEELELAKVDLIGARLRQLQSNRGLAFEVSLDELYGLGYEHFKEVGSRIQAVTKQDIKRIIKKYLRVRELTIVTIGPLEAAK
jgi:zinc protease